MQHAALSAPNPGSMLDVGSIREDQDYGGLRTLLLALVTAAKVRRKSTSVSEMPLP
jgi:hypothetical protein